MIKKENTIKLKSQKDYSFYIFFTAITIIILIGTFLILNNVFNKDNNTKTIEVSGQSELEETAKIAYVYLGYNNLNETAEKAEQQNSFIINKIKEALVLKGINPDDIETEAYYLNEEYSWENGKQTFRGYRVYHTLKIKSEDMKNLGFIITSSINAGANFVNNLEFTLEDNEISKLKKQALIDASKNARDKAEAIALGSGTKIKSLKTISDTTYNYYPWRYDIMYSKAEAGASGTSESFDENTITSINAGKVTISASVRAIFEIA